MKNPPSQYSGYSGYSSRTGGGTNYGSPGGPQPHYSYATTPSPGVPQEPQEIKYVHIVSTAETPKKIEPENLGVKVDYVQIDQKKTNLISGQSWAVFGAPKLPLLNFLILFLS